MITQLNNKLQEHFNKMCSTGKLFRVKLTGREIWDLYINSFTEEENPIFRDPNSSTHDCNLCKNFIRRYGNIVSLDENFNIVSIFDIEDKEYERTLDVLSKSIRNSEIENVFFETYDELNSLNYEKCSINNSLFRLGLDRNVKRYTREEANLYPGVVRVNEIRTFSHLHLDLPKQFVDFSGKSIEAIQGEFRDKYSVFKRAMEEIPLDTLLLVRDLINQGSLLDGTSHLHSVEEYIEINNSLKSIASVNLNTENWFWDVSYFMEERTAKFRNTLIGVLCTELAEGMELNKACLNWNKRVDPANYHKATAPITKKQINEARKFVEENGYEESFDRRLATIDDIRASEILHLNSGNGEIPKVSLFDNVKSTSTRHKRSQFDKVQTISIDDFMKNVVPNCNSIEAYLENRMEGNLVTMTKASDNNSKKAFKWDNNYSWTFNGNLAGKSQIKEAVKNAGGKVDGVLRFSITWNDKDTQGIVDFDAHCIQPGGPHIYYSSMRGHTGGQLDVDMINPTSLGVENIFWKSVPNKEGKYLFFCKNYNGKNNRGFRAEIEFEGNIYSYEKLGNLKGDTNVATVTFKEGKFSIEHHLPETNQSKDLWGLETNNFHKVNLICVSPNHWGENQIGNLHYMFMLDKCYVDTSVRSFHNENLNSELLKHRKVMEVLGATNMIESNNNNQLSGLGFNSTVKDNLIVRCKGSHNRLLKVEF